MKKKTKTTNSNGSMETNMANPYEVEQRYNTVKLIVERLQEEAKVNEDQIINLRLHTIELDILERTVSKKTFQKYLVTKTNKPRKSRAVGRRTKKYPSLIDILYNNQ